MADTQRTRAALLALFADNVTGQISAQDFRDYVVTVMNSEFAGTGDFWRQPDPQYLTTDATTRGWVVPSQLVDSDCSFGNIMMKNTSGAWIRADVTGSDLSNTRRIYGVALDSYTSNDSTAQILRKGLIKHNSVSGILTGNIGKNLELLSGAPGSITATGQTSGLILGYIETEGSDHTISTTDVWRFNPPNWGVVGN